MAGAGLSSAVVTDVQSELEPVDEIKEYEKILRISDQIFTGTHPRLKVPEQFVRKPPSRPPQSSIAPAVIESSGSHQPKTVPVESSLAQKKTVSSVVSPARTPSSVAPKPAPGLDPIFLTKSDDLVRAEIQLQRRRIENALKEQFERSKNEARQRTAHEGRPEFDVTEVLKKAMEIVKPLPSPVQPVTHDATISSDSIDDNSLYSSRAPDSPLTWDYEKRAPSEPDRQTLGQTKGIAHQDNGRKVTDTGSQILQGTTDKAILPQGRSQPEPIEQNRQHEQMVLDEPEYSPPEPIVPVVEIGADDDYQPPDILDSTRHTTFPPQPSARPSDVKVVRNHITSPAAPQPSRVSPLAIAKAPSVQRILSSRSRDHDFIEGDGSDPYSRRTSPEGPAQQHLLPRKRRRVQEPRERIETLPIDVAETRVKLEPVSPPPFHDTPPSRAYHASEHPVYIDISSPQYVPSADRREYVSREPFHELDPRYGSSGRGRGTPGEASVRAVSRLSTRRPVRDNQDLRRVASLHNARNPDSASHEIIEPVLRPQSAARASPFTVVERQPLEKTTYYEEVIPTYSRRYSQYREYYVDDGAAPRYVEPAPPRRIVMDEYGNQYYEMIPAHKIRAAPLPTRIVRPDDYGERAYVRSASVRAPSIVDDGYGGRQYIQEMAPPSGTYRRLAEQGRNASETQRLYPARTVADREGVFRSGSVAVDYAPAPRQATYIEEEIPRNRLVRTSSVRPPTSRYEQPHDGGLHRVQSVRPGGREVSVYMDEDGHHVAREYSERPGYPAAVRAERPSRYITDEDGTRVAIEGPGDVHRVAVPRY
ncbi:conserved hypothetical protein [Talaromyces stipitatus ATCC 10500]|uniref:Uncharacterized protein n=1 Tax=Talaromyces stipitatus (strain ATCC 10500 / CBS 375.48 / QM 6759 / NRRL 1006) TaxID=441959 RepID=B8MRP6_TALSN|nr:uncharacterized protein TSTA_056990 [Talaromyces stipitatus ATCC 10500]EED13203.1 conserved hypothetical protein [Talaromyces stipitatus ATCC 10500]